MSTGQSLQESFLSDLCQADVTVSIYLVNGIKLHGIIDAYDDHVIMLKNAVTQMVFKHAVSTIVPNKPVAAHSQHPQEVQ